MALKRSGVSVCKWCNCLYPQFTPCFIYTTSSVYTIKATPSGVNETQSGVSETPS
jgi:hypothetical protein